MKIFVGIMMISMLLSGCGGAKTVDVQKKETAPSSVNSVSQQNSDPQSEMATLYTNMETGSESAQFETHSFEYTGELTAQVLADGLSQITGLDFFITSTTLDDEIYIDWAQNSTLIANLDEREQNTDFHFFDADSMRWFMMDSLWRTLSENLGVEKIYYTMNGGNDLVFDDLSPINKFPANSPYMGSAFYAAHSDVMGEDFISLDGAYQLVQNVIYARGEDAPVIMQTEDDIIDGEHAFTFSAGDYSVDGQKFTAMYHYAVTDSGKVYYLDMSQGYDWIFFDTQANG